MPARLSGTAAASGMGRTELPEAPPALHVCCRPGCKADETGSSQTETSSRTPCCTRRGLGRVVVDWGSWRRHAPRAAHLFSGWLCGLGPAGEHEPLARPQPWFPAKTSVLHRDWRDERRFAERPWRLVGLSLTECPSADVEARRLRPVRTITPRSGLVIPGAHRQPANPMLGSASPEAVHR
jgi:hypothetical protein